MPLPPMTEGGAWMSRSADQAPVYVHNADNVAHLLNGGGWTLVEDPRDDPDKPPAEEPGEEAEESSEEEAAEEGQAEAEGESEEGGEEAAPVAPRRASSRRGRNT